MVDRAKYNPDHEAPLHLLPGQKRIVRDSAYTRCLPTHLTVSQGGMVGPLTDEDARVEGTYLQYSQLMHLLISASGDHLLQDAKLFIHLGTPSPLNQTVGCFPGYLPPSCARRAWLLPLLP